ncbi:asparagine synthase (glutamine-hydrolyzing) [Polynucleobacter paneuropaeus]|nr:asparagine synthase (glutamine-hydrolyzing) [Polynucleobacter paneuropaeus]MBT8541011.1 asparagine synthase (glutamine-hydrolyzing) [Polynucleobacter paneuropaeus]MBT8555580.1 asparagine synthase (glutamine-hydrolyzing) [Polynucleobacter paneuropaeus]MBT8560856.1 asparagine synthase (glutamine-hydrolyzing) [Polynucleobacter paneuropaeus]
MCGILGCLSVVDKFLFKKALSTIAHRGPDSSGIFQDNFVTLGHNRLSILDLSTLAAQPFTDSIQRYTIIFNGEIYNYIEIGEILKNNNIVLRSNSDTEIFLEAYKFWGVDCFRRFNGMWSVAIWDSWERRLLLSRDRFGKKPLFFSLTKFGFIFASEMKAIYPFLKSLDISSKVIPDAFDNPFFYEASRDTCFKDIHRFPAAHYAFVELDGSIKMQKYYQLEDEVGECGLSYPDAVEKFRDLFLSSVTLRMRSDVPIGTALSGGLDSSATFSAMASLGGPQMNLGAFCAHFPGSPIDEIEYARQVTSMYGRDLNVVEIDPVDSWDHIEEYIYKIEDPYLTCPIPMILTYEAMRKQGVVVTLDGHGADELMCGYGPDLFGAIPDAGLLGLMDIANTYSDLTESSNDGQFKKMPAGYALLRHGVKRGIRAYAGTMRSGNFTGNMRGSLNRELLAIFQKTVLPTLLRNYDRYSMLSGVEIRMPFMDHRLVEFCFSLPWNFKIGNGYTKKIIRDAVSDFVPNKICWRKNKIGFNSPMVDWLKGPLNTWAKDTIHSRDFLENDWVSYPKAKKIIDRIDSGSAKWSDGEQFWSQVQKVLWCRSLKFANKLPLQN